MLHIGKGIGGSTNYFFVAKYAPCFADGHIVLAKMHAVGTKFGN